MKAAARPGLELAVSSCPSPAWPEVPAPHPREGARDGGAPSLPVSSSHSSWLPGDPHLARKHLLAQGRAPDPDSRSPAGLGPSSGWAHRWSCCSRLSAALTQVRSAGTASRPWEQRRRTRPGPRGEALGAQGSWVLGRETAPVWGERLSLPGPLTLPPAPLPREQQPAPRPPPPTLRLARAQSGSLFHLLACVGLCGGSAWG